MNPATAKLALLVSRVKEKRIALNYTQQYVAGKLNISQHAYSKLESGQTSITVERLYQLAEILETDISYFIR